MVSLAAVTFWDQSKVSFLDLTPASGTAETSNHVD